MIKPLEAVRPAPKARASIASGGLAGLRWPARWGWPGAAALLAAVLALGVSAVWVPRLEAQAATAREEASADRRRAEQVRLSATAAVRPTLATDGLPAAHTADDGLADLIEAGLKAGVRVDRIQQRIEVRGPVQALRVGMSTSASYAELRGFVADALRADPGLALDRISMRRPSASSGRLDAELQWSILRQAGPGDARTPESPR